MKTTELIKFYKASDNGFIDLSAEVSSPEDVFGPIKQGPDIVLIYNADTGVLQEISERPPLQATTTGDYVLYGCDLPFFEIFEVVTGVHDATIVWQYSTAYGWDDIILADHTNNFKEPGKIQLIAPKDWERQIIAGYNFFWLKGVVVSVSAISQVPATTKTLVGYEEYHKVYVRNENNETWYSPRLFFKELPEDNDKVVVGAAYSIADGDAGFYRSYSYVCPNSFTHQDVIMLPDLYPNEYAGFWIMRRKLAEDLVGNNSFKVVVYGW